MNNEDDMITGEGEIETASVAEVLELARQRRTLRGLPRPKGLPPTGWYARHKVRGHAYLYYRWVEPDSDRTRAKSLGPLN